MSTKDNFAWLTTVPASDCGFKSSVKECDDATLARALEDTGRRQDKTRFLAILAESKRRYKTAGQPVDSLPTFESFTRQLTVATSKALVPARKAPAKPVTVTLDNLEVLSPKAQDPGARISQVNEYHDLARLSMAQSCAYMILAGIELIELRKDADHGAWEKLFPQRGNVKSGCASTFAFSYDAARKYMGFAAAAKKHVPELRSLVDSGVTLGQLDQGQRDRLVSVVKKVGDGHTYQQLALEWGVAKKPPGGPGGHNPADDDGNAPTEDTPELKAIDIWTSILRDLSLHGLDEKDWVHLPDRGEVSRETLAGVITDLAAAVREAAPVVAARPSARIPKSPKATNGKAAR